jgi:hypothetical protein
MKVIVRDRRGKNLIAQTISEKDGRFEIPLPPGSYQVEAVDGLGRFGASCIRTVKVRRDEKTRMELDVYVPQP